MVLLIILNSKYPYLLGLFAESYIIPHDSESPLFDFRIAVGTRDLFIKVPVSKVPRKVFTYNVNIIFDRKNPLTNHCIL